jgi:hypothetical protein
METMAADDRNTEMTVETSDDTVNEVLRDAGFQVTEAGRRRWRERLAMPIPAEALQEGQRMREQARRRAA